MWQSVAVGLNLSFISNLPRYVLLFFDLSTKLDLIGSWTCELDF